MVSRSSTYNEPPAQSGSSATDRWARRPGPQSQVVATSYSRTVECELDGTGEADQTPGGSGTYSAMSCSLQTTSCRRLSTSGRAATPAPA